MKRIGLLLAGWLLAFSAQAVVVDCVLTQGGGRSDLPNSGTENTADPMNPNGATYFYLFRADMAACGITAGATINSAALRLYSEISFGGGVLTLYEMLQPWIAGQVSWNNYNAVPTAWNTAGASGSGTDRSSSSVGSYTLLSSEDGVFINSGNGISVSASVVQGWISGSNNGIGLFSDGSVFADFSGVSDATNPPRLRVDYTPASSGTKQRTTLGAG